ncbi:MAG: hypothetical protein AAF678_11670 [Pseudomonadota bacterium]
MPNFLKICGIALLGLAVICAGFLYDLMFAGLPYQDPPPELLADWMRHKRISGIIMIVGLFLVVSGIAAIPLIWYRLRKRQGR